MAMVAIEDAPRKEWSALALYVRISLARRNDEAAAELKVGG